MCMYVHVCVGICIYQHVYKGINRYMTVYVGMCKYVPGYTWNIFHHFLIQVCLDGSVVYRANSAPDDGCSSSKNVKAILLRFACLLQSWFLLHETAALHVHHFLCTAGNIYQIPTHTYIYMHIHAHSYTYMLIHTNTCKYLYILHVCECMSLYCMYMQVCLYL